MFPVITVSLLEGLTSRALTRYGCGTPFIADINSQSYRECLEYRPFILFATLTASQVYRDLRDQRTLRDFRKLDNSNGTSQLSRRFKTLKFFENTPAPAPLPIRSISRRDIPLR